MIAAALWWCLGADPGGLVLGLADAIALGRQAAVEVLVAELDLAAVEVERSIARSTMLPSVTVGLDARELFFGREMQEVRTLLPPKDGREDVDLVYGPFRDSRLSSASHPWITLSVQLRQLLYDGGRWWNLLARADDLEAARRANVAVVEATLRLAIVTSFYALALAEDDVEIARFQANLSEAQLARAQALLGEGRAKVSDVVASERNLAADRVGLARRELVRTERRHALLALLGQRPSLPLAIVVPDEVRTGSTSPSVPRLPAPGRMVELALAERPEIARARANLAVLARNVSIEEADHYPVFALTGSYARQSRRPDRVFADPTEGYTANVGLNVRWNAFVGHQISAEVERAELALARERLSFANLERQIEREVLDRRERLRVHLEVYELARSGEDSAIQAVRLDRSAYQEGKISAFQLRDSELRLTRARRSLRESRYDIEITLEDLRRALGADLSALSEAR